jgi:hypothetical protein
MSNNKALMVDAVHVHSRKWAKPLKKFGKYYTSYNTKEGVYFYETALKNEAPYTFVLFEDPTYTLSAKEFVSKIRELEKEYQAKPALIFAFRDKDCKEEELEDCDEYVYGEFDPEWLIDVLDNKYKCSRKVLKKPYRGFGKTSY